MKALTAALAALAVAAMLGPASASAQRRSSAPDPPVLTVTQSDDPHRVELTVEARERLELSADRRWLRAEIRGLRGRRVVCAAPVRPRVGSRSRVLEPGARWSEWLDVRELCWGRALDALATATEVRWTFDAGRGRGAWVARVAGRTLRSLAAASTTWRGSGAPGDAGGASSGAPVRVELAPTDVAPGGRPALRVRIVGQARARAFVRHESVSFRVRAPSGRAFECAVAPFAGRPLPDFFARLVPGRPTLLTLDAAAYCGPLREPGIYEVTPVLTLRERGAEWRLDAITGTFVGAPSVLRVRSTTYVEQPVE
jgi:hypothetical protein